MSFKEFLVIESGQEQEQIDEGQMSDVIGDLRNLLSKEYDDKELKDNDWSLMSNAERAEAIKSAKMLFKILTTGL